MVPKSDPEQFGSPEVEGDQEQHLPVPVGDNTPALGPKDELKLAGRTFRRIGGAIVDFATGVPVGSLVSSYLDFRDGRRDAVGQDRFWQAMEGVQLRLGVLEEAGVIDREFVEGDEFPEIVDEYVAAQVRERSAEKRELFANLLSRACQVDVDRSWYPTGRRLLEVIEPVHVQVLADLARKSKDVDASDVGLSIHREECDMIRDHHPVALDLFGWAPMAYRGALAKEVLDVQHLEAIEAVIEHWAPANQVAAREAIEVPGITLVELERYLDGRSAIGLEVAIEERRSQWTEEVLAHFWYLGGMGLIHQVGESRAQINALSERLLEWLQEPVEPDENTEDKPTD